MLDTRHIVQPGEVAQGQTREASIEHDVHPGRSKNQRELAEDHAICPAIFLNQIQTFASCEALEELMSIFHDVGGLEVPKCLKCPMPKCSVLPL